MSRLMRLLCFVIGVLLLTVARPIFVPAKEPAEAQSQLKSLLMRPVLAEGQPLAEVKKFCERRIAEMPHRSAHPGPPRASGYAGEREFVLPGVRPTTPSSRATSLYWTATHQRCLSAQPPWSKKSSRAFIGGRSRPTISPATARRPGELRSRRTTEGRVAPPFNGSYP